MYLLLPAVGGEMGPHKSPCMSSNAFSARNEVESGNGRRACFPNKHDEHVPFSIVSFGRPNTS